MPRLCANIPITNPTTDKHGFLVVYPDGFDNTWNDCRGGSNDGYAMPLEGEDLDSPVVIWDFFSKLPSR